MADRTSPMLDTLCIPQPAQNSMTPVTLENVLCDWLFHWNKNISTTVHYDTLDVDWNQCAVTCLVLSVQFTACSARCEYDVMNSDSAIYLHPLVASPAPPDSCTTQSLNHGWQQEWKPNPAPCQQTRISIDIIQIYLKCQQRTVKNWPTYSAT